MIGIMTMNLLVSLLFDAEINFYEILDFRSSFLSVIRCYSNELYHTCMLNSAILSYSLPELLFKRGLSTISHKQLS